MRLRPKKWTLARSRGRLKTPSRSGPQPTGLEVAAMPCDATRPNQRPRIHQSLWPCAAAPCSCSCVEVDLGTGAWQGKSATVPARCVESPWQLFTQVLHPFTPLPPLSSPPSIGAGERGHCRSCARTGYRKGRQLASCMLIATRCTRPLYSRDSTPSTYQLQTQNCTSDVRPSVPVATSEPQHS